MLLERAEIVIRKGSEEDFAAVMKERGIGCLIGFPGVSSVKLGRGVENPEKFMLLVAWDSMESHIAFTNSPVFTEFKQMFAPYSVGGSMEHFNMG